MRGFALDNRYNFRRDGLPVSTQTITGLENKERLELLKGTSGMQAGTSAPGGLMNYVVKRPPTRDTQGLRDLVVLAMDWRVDASNRLEWEFEQSQVEQISVNFYSLMGNGPNALPAPVDGTRNITASRPTHTLVYLMG